MLTDKVKIKLDEIGQYLLSLDGEQDLSPGLLSGTAGIALFLFYYARYLKNEYIADKAMEFLSYSINKSEKDFRHTFCSGVSGICWCINHLVMHKFIDKDNLEIIEVFDLHLGRNALKDSSIAYYDYLHGSCGTFIYLLKRIQNLNIKQYEREFINSLDCSKIAIENSCYWESKIGNVKNISISHGIASICVFLAKAYELNLNKVKAKELATQGIKFILNQENLSTEGLISKYPSFYHVDSGVPTNNNSRLGWCYGDLGIAFALWHYSQVFHDKTIEHKAIDIMLFSAQRRNLNTNAVIDASLCHGTAGIALIFRRMYLNTGMIEFKEAFDYWIEQTLLMSKYPEAPVGYKANMKTDSIGFLEGISGIGLVLLSFFEKEDTHWDECLLLS